MTELTMIPIEKLRHHPQNPRKSIGDVTELAESIKAKGIMQNLTVVQCPSALGEYWVVIGNRRLEASKQAGVKELPCLVSQMDEKEQFQTMLIENMQRADLTVPEQAEGFQYMLDLGETVDSISEKTGFSKSTVRRRLDLAQLNKKAFQAAYDNGGTMEDFVKISQIRSKSKQNELLKLIGTANFAYAIKNALLRQQAEENFKIVEKILKEHNCAELKDGEQWSNAYERCYSDDIKLCEELDIKNVESRAEKYDYFYNSGLAVSFFKKVKKQKPQQTSNAEKEEKKLQAARRQKEKDFYELRTDFIKELAHKKKLSSSFKEACLNAVTEAASSGIYISSNRSVLFALGGYEYSYGAGEESNKSHINEWRTSAPEGCVACCVYSILNDCKSESYFGYQGSKRTNKSLDITYEFLCDLGYQMCDEEKAWQAGTHELYAKADI